MAETLRNLALSACAVLVALALAEGIMRLAGSRPGVVRPGVPDGILPLDPLFNEVNPADLLNPQIFRADEDGVFKADPEYFEPGQVSDGFRSIPKPDHDPPAAKILFLGDSLTWGHSAEPITNSFVDRVAAAGYLCYNDGIPGTDLNQYAFLAEKHVPVLKPDFVAVMIFMGNDLDSRVQNPMRPHQNVFQITDRGWYYAFDREGRYMTPAEAYVFCNNLVFQYYKNSGSLVRTVVETSVAGAYAGVGLALLGERLHRYWSPQGPRSVDPDYVRGALQRIRAVCDANRSRLLVFLVAAHPGKVDRDTGIAENMQLFAGYDPLFPDSLTPEDYAVLPDDHLNNAGHRKYADFILRTLRTSDPRGLAWDSPAAAP